MDQHGTALPMDGADLEFRDELRTWLEENLVDDFAGQHDRGGPDDDDNWELRRAWEHKLGEGTWLGLSWPKRFGGREATLTQEILFAMEYAGAGAPPRAGFHGETLMAPTALHYGTEEQKARLLPPMARERSSGARATPSRVQGRTSPTSPRGRTSRTLRRAQDKRQSG